MESEESTRVKVLLWLGEFLLQRNLSQSFAQELTFSLGTLLLFTFSSEAHGYGVYFAVYELLVANEIKSKGLKSRDELNLGKSAMFGAAAGWGMWLL